MGYRFIIFATLPLHNFTGYNGQIVLHIVPYSVRTRRLQGPYSVRTVRQPSLSSVLTRSSQGTNRVLSLPHI
jgi:hypothetical protein